MKDTFTFLLLISQGQVLFQSRGPLYTGVGDILARFPPPAWLKILSLDQKHFNQY